MGDIEGIIRQLEQQREAIDRAVEALRAVGSGGVPGVKRRGRPPGTKGQAAPAKRRGRPPGSKHQSAPAKKRGGKRTMSPEGRKRIAEAARKRWAEARAAKEAAG